MSFCISKRGCSSPTQRSEERAACPAKPDLLYLIGRYFVERTGHQPFDHRVMKVDPSGRFVVVGVYDDSQPAWSYAQARAVTEQAFFRHKSMQLTNDELGKLAQRCEVDRMIAGPPHPALGF